MWRETHNPTIRRAGNNISIHSLRVEGDVSAIPTAPKIIDFNPLPPCGGRPIKPLWDGYKITISIHSLRVEGDGAKLALERLFGISIHSLRVEGDKCNMYGNPQSCLFQSTPSVWRETYLHVVTSLFMYSFQSTPSVWRETLNKS